jgi:hypothetical protein
MATAHIESDGPCDWGRIPLDDHNYSCLVSANGMHDWSQQSTTVVFCNECGRVA